MANLVIITGPLAVGKMTVAEELRNRIGYNMMINHDSIEVSDKIFGFNNPAQKEFNKLVREKAFETTIKYNESMIFTMCIAFDLVEERENFDKLKNKFESNGGIIYLLELSASQEKRLERNVTPNRLEKKKSKQDVEWSNNDLKKCDDKYRLNSYEEEYWCENHFKINNENLEPKQVVDMFLEKFSLKEEFKEKSTNKMY